MAIAQEIIDRILGTADIVGIIGEHVKLSKRSGQYWGMCPFHNEKTSSFTVSPAKGIYKCFGCGKGGNVISFLQEHEKMSFPEAVRYLGKRYNIEIPEKELTPEELQREKKREAQQVALRAATLLFTRNRFSKEAKEYLIKRGFSPEDSIIERYQIGYAMAHRATSEALKKQGFPTRCYSTFPSRGKAKEARTTIIFKIESCFLISALPEASSVFRPVTVSRRIMNPSTAIAGRPIYSKN